MQSSTHSFLLCVCWVVGTIGTLMYCPFLSWFCHVLPCRVVSCLVQPCPVMSCPVLCCPALSCHVPSHSVLSCPVMPCHVPSCHVLYEVYPHIGCTSIQGVLTYRVYSSIACTHIQGAPLYRCLARATRPPVPLFPTCRGSGACIHYITHIVIDYMVSGTLSAFAR